MPTVGGETTPQGRYRKRYKDLRSDQDSYRPHWKTIVEYMAPRRGRYLTSEQDDRNTAGSRKDQKIINGSANDALRIIAAGLQGGLTSPSRPWFALTLPDPDLMEFAPVREWLHDTRNRILNVMARSNYYSATHNQYHELAAFGTGPMLIEESYQTVIRCRPFTIGEYVLGLDSAYRVNTLYRMFAMKVHQLIEKFGLDNLPQNVRDMKDTGKEKFLEVIHCIQPNQVFDPVKADYRGMRFESVYFLANHTGEDDKFLKQGGYLGIPFSAPRWQVVGVNTYGDSPAMDAIGDVKMLQKLEEKKLKKIDKHVDPPMNAPAALKAKGGNIIAGGVNYIDILQGQQAFSPAYQVDANIQAVAAEIDRVEQRIRRFFFNDLFITILTADKHMTAYEVARRHEEKLLMLGPVLEQLESEKHDQDIDRIYSIMDNLGLIAPPPREIQGMEMKTEYIGLLAQAQKMVGTASVEQTANFVGALAAFKPDVVDKFDFDQAVDEYGDMTGVPPRLIVSDDKVAAIRAQRAQQQQQLQAQATAIEGADAAKKLSETEVGKGSALDALIERRRTA